MTNSDIVIEPVRQEDLRSTILGFERLGIRPKIEGTRLSVSSGQERRIRPDLGGHVPKLEDGPWPAFPADVMSTTIVTATQCSGMLLVFEKMFESRLFFVDKLIGMGARIVLCDPHRAVISGPRRSRAAPSSRPTSGPAWPCCWRRSPPKGPAPSTTWGRSSGATSGSTSGCGRWEPRSSGWMGRAEWSSGAAGQRGAEADAPSAQRSSSSRDQSRGSRSRVGTSSTAWSPALRAAAGAGRGFDLGLWSSEPVGEVMRRWLAFRRAAGVPGGRLGNQVHGVELMSLERRQGLDSGGGDRRVDHHHSRHPAHRDHRRLHPGLSCRARTGVALLHAGWRGTAGGILGRGIEQLDSGDRVSASRYRNALWCRHMRRML